MTRAQPAQNELARRGGLNQERGAAEMEFTSPDQAWLTDLLPYCLTDLLPWRCVVLALFFDKHDAAEDKDANKSEE